MQESAAFIESRGALTNHRKTSPLGHLNFRHSLALDPERLKQRNEKEEAQHALNLLLLEARNGGESAPRHTKNGG